MSCKENWERVVGKAELLPLRSQEEIGEGLSLVSAKSKAGEEGQDLYPTSCHPNMSLQPYSSL